MISVLYCLALTLVACIAQVRLYGIPEMRFSNSSVSCVSSLPASAARWLQNRRHYNRTVHSTLPTSQLQDREEVQCALETDEGISDWSRVMKYYGE